MSIPDLYAEAQVATVAAVRTQEANEAEALQSMGVRLRAEQDRLVTLILSNLAPVVREAAASGRRVATILAFSGADKLDEFSYLYMLKGPHKHEHRQEMKAMGASPLIHSLRRALAPFMVHHAWQRASNDNVLSVSW